MNEGVPRMRSRSTEAWGNCCRKRANAWARPSASARVTDSGDRLSKLGSGGCAGGKMPHVNDGAPARMPRHDTINNRIFMDFIFLIKLTALFTVAVLARYLAFQARQNRSS